MLGCFQNRSRYAETHDRIAAALAQTTGCRLVSVDYRLAPCRPCRSQNFAVARDEIYRTSQAIIHTAEFDPMRDEGNAYAGKLLVAGVAVDHVCHEGMIHNFHAIGAILPQGRLVLH